MIANRVLVPKSDRSAVNQLFNGYKRRQKLIEILYQLYLNRHQSLSVYNMKVDLRQKIFDLLSKRLEERIDLYLIGSSLTSLGSNSSDTDLCLIIYNSQNKIDVKYDDKNNVISKLEQLSQILQ